MFIGLRLAANQLYGGGGPLTGVCDLAKRRFGEAARSVADQGIFRRGLARMLSRASGRSSHHRGSAGEDGFTLIELVIVVAVMPMVVGALAVGILSVFSLQSSVSNRLTDSDDAQITSINFSQDVQAAVLLTTASSPASPSACTPPPPATPGSLVLALQLGNSTEVTYWATQNLDGSTYTLSRDVCTLSGGTPTYQSSSVVGRDLKAIPVVSVPQCATPTTPTIAACVVEQAAVPPSTPAIYQYQTTWVLPIGITGVSFQGTGSGSSYAYQFSAVPNAAASSTNSFDPSVLNPGGSFAVPGSGTYAQTLFFVDFSNWNTQTAATGVSCTGGTTSNPVLPMSAAIANTQDTLTFCLSVSATSSSGQNITAQSSAPASCNEARAGLDDIGAVPLPTYSCPPTSAAFLGNNGFYTGVTGDPALYEIANGSTATISMTNIQVANSNGVAASGWQLVTGDAESTDIGESITWTSSAALTLLPNFVNSSGVTTSAIGNACQGAPPTNTGTLSGLGTTTVKCSASYSTDKTGTPMLETQTPSSLKIILNGGGTTGNGLQATFLGVLL